MRGLYRAAKRNEPWAVKLLKLKETNPLSFLFQRVYGDKIKDLVQNSNPFLNLIKHTNYNRGFYHQPIILGLEPISFKVDGTPKKRKGYLW